MDSLRLEGRDREFRMTKFPDIDAGISDRSRGLRIILEEIFLLVFERFCFPEGDTELITELLSIPSLITREENDLETEYFEPPNSLWNSFDDIAMYRKCAIEIEDDRLDLHISDSWNCVDHNYECLRKYSHNAPFVRSSQINQARTSSII